MGFSLYPDPLIDAGFGTVTGKRIFLPIGHDIDRAIELRREGWITIAALSGADDAKALGCEAMLTGKGIGLI
jgi:ATP phosphoribosyltransferase regulatory subunit